MLFVCKKIVECKKIIALSVVVWLKIKKKDYH